MTRFLAVSSAILLSTLSAGLFAVSSAHAASSYDDTVHVIDKLEVISGDGNKKLDLSTTLMSNLQTCSPDGYSSLNSVVSSSGGRWSFYVQQESTNSGYKQSVNLVWIKTLRTDYDPISFFGTFGGQAGVTALISPYDSQVTMKIDNNGTLHCDYGSTDPVQNGYWGAYISTSAQDQAYTTKLFLSTYPVTYPDGYSGIQIPSTVQPGTYPDFGYTVNNDLQLKILYLQNLDISNGYKWSYTTYQSDSDWSPNTEIDSRSLRLNEIYEQQLPAVGNYVVKIHLESPPPLLDRNDIKNIELRITATGNYDVGSTILNDCVDGVCTQKLCVTGSVFDKMSCKLRNQINVGVLNPTINILVSLYQSMTVKQGVCTQLLPDSPPINGQVLPFSQLSTKTCEWSDSIRGNIAFAWVTVIVNLLFAMMIFIGIKNLVNKILDNRDDEVIQS